MPHRLKKRYRRFVLLIIIAVGIFFTGYYTGYVPPISFQPRSTEVFDFIEAEAAPYSLDPHFVYAIAFAESSLKPTAWTTKARGIMQISKCAWITVSHRPYREAWNWRSNIEVGIQYLAYCRRFLERHDAFSYPNLAAAYHYGIGAIQRENFEAHTFLTQERNHIYQALIQGKNPAVKLQP